MMATAAATTTAGMGVDVRVGLATTTAATATRTTTSTPPHDVHDTHCDAAALSVAPRVYLVPAGLDVMIIPNSDTLETRQWNVVDQSIPPPFVTTDTDLADPDFFPTIHTLRLQSTGLTSINLFSGDNKNSDPHSIVPLNSMNGMTLRSSLPFI